VLLQERPEFRLKRPPAMMGAPIGDILDYIGHL
jgi:hypothetical protein